MQKKADLKSRVIGERIGLLRNKKGETLRAMERNFRQYSGMLYSYSAIHAWENGCLPSGDVIRLLVQYFDCDPDYLDINKVNLMSIKKSDVVEIQKNHLFMHHGSPVFICIDVSDCEGDEMYGEWGIVDIMDNVIVISQFKKYTIPLLENRVYYKPLSYSTVGNPCLSLQEAMSKKNVWLEFIGPKRMKGEWAIYDSIRKAFILPDNAMLEELQYGILFVAFAEPYDQEPIKKIL